MKYQQYAKFEFAKNLRFLVSKIDDLEKRFLKVQNIDISQRELDYIALIAANSGKSFTDLIKQESISKSTFSNQVKALENKGLVLYEMLKDSKKAKTLTLTEKGKKIFSLYEQIRIQFFEKYVKTYFTDSELNMIASAVSKLLLKLKTEL